MTKSILIRFDERTIELPNGQTVEYYDTGGSLRALIMIHGLGSDKKAWIKMMEELKGSFRCIAIDLPKFLGDSSKSHIDLNYYASLLPLLTEQLSLEDPVLLGHSMGGQIAILAALRDSKNHFSEMILCAPAGFEAFDERDYKWFETYVTKEHYQQRSDRQMRKAFDLNFYGLVMPEDAEFMYEERIRMKQDSSVFCDYNTWFINCVFSMLVNPVADDLSKLKTRTLVIFGADDALIPNRLIHPHLSTVTVARSGTEQIQNGSLVILPETGHYLIWEKAVELATLTKEFIKE